MGLYMGKRSKRNARSIRPIDDLLQGAVFDDNQAEVLRLLAAGANIDTTTGTYKLSLLVSCGGKITTPAAGAEMARLLISKGIKIDSRDRNGRNPIRFAVEVKRWGVVQALLNAGADPMLPDRWGDMAADLMSDPAATAAFQFYVDGVAAAADADDIGSGMAEPQGENLPDRGRV